LASPAQLTVWICSPASLVSCALVMYAYVYHRRNHSVSYLHIIFMIAFNDACFAITSLAGVPEPGNACRAQAFFVVYFLLCSVCWTMALCHYFLEAYVNNHDFIFGSKGVPTMMYAFGQLVPLLPALAPVAIYEPAGEWCWIPATYVAARFCTFYLVVWIGWVYVIYVAVKTRLHYKRLEGQLQANALLEDKEKMVRLQGIKWYPLVLFACYAAGSVARICESIYDEDFTNLTLAHTVMQTLQGVFNAGIYFWTQDLCEDGMFACCRRTNGHAPLTEVTNQTL